MTRGSIWCAVAALGLLACAPKDNVDVGSVYVASGLIKANEGGTIEVDESTSAAMSGTRIVVAAGSLAQDTRITIAFGPSDLEDSDGDGAGPSVTFGPSATSFDPPALVTLPYAGEFDEDRVRIWVRQDDGQTSVIMPEQIRYDPDRKMVTFEVGHFTSFRSGRARRACSHVRACPSGRCRRGRCMDCAPRDCGTPASTEKWRCEDGTEGGFLNKCERVNGACEWKYKHCFRPCTRAECGRVPPDTPRDVCVDGSVPALMCKRAASGACEWQREECQRDCTGQCGRPPDDTRGGLCSDGTLSGWTCRRNAGNACEWELIKCPCADGSRDPNCPPSCDTILCAPGYRCDESTGTCTAEGEVCGPNVCGPGKTCCNASCGICVAPNETCIEAACTPCGDGVCQPGEQCRRTGNGPRCLTLCSRADCPSARMTYMCEDGTQGGDTEECVRLSANTGCVWERNACAQACTARECPQPSTPMMCADGLSVLTTCTRQANGNCIVRQRCVNSGN